jgi:alternative ribosome-rescue factor
MKHDHGRGTIKDNAMAALVTSTLFRPKVVKPKKGKGSFSRKGVDKVVIDH